MSDRDRGQIGAGAAEVYDSLFVPALFGRFADAIADIAQIERTDDVVDVACGTGALTRALRRRTTARVVGVDINPGMLDVARHHGRDIDYVHGDAQDLMFAAGEFDVATTQFGIMFLPDPVRGLRELARISRRGTVAVWDAIETSEGYVAMQELFHDTLGPDAARSLDAPFAMGRAGALEALFGDAGIDGVAYCTVAATGRFDSIEQWVTTEVRGWTLSDSVSAQQLGELIEAARVRLRTFMTADGCVFGMAAKAATWTRA